MRILVFGAGVLGGNLANNLFRAGKDVTLLARGAWGKQIRENGLIIKHRYAFRTTCSRIRVIETLEPDDHYDMIFVVMRYTQLDHVIPVLNANCSENIVLLGNNVQSAEYEAKLTGKHVWFAFALSAGHREADRIESIDLKRITIGPRRGNGSDNSLLREIFSGTGYKVSYQQNMEDYLLCHAAFVIPAAMACYYTDGDLRKVKNDTAYLNRVIDAIIEGYRAIENAGHEIIPASDKNYASKSYRKACLFFFRVMCATSLGKLCASDHALNATEEMGALNEGMKAFFDQNNASYPAWKMIEAGTKAYLQ